MSFEFSETCYSTYIHTYVHTFWWCFYIIHPGIRCALTYVHTYLRIYNIICDSIIGVGKVLLNLLHVHIYYVCAVLFNCLCDRIHPNPSLHKYSEAWAVIGLEPMFAHAWLVHTCTTDREVSHISCMCTCDLPDIYVTCS